MVSQQNKHFTITFEYEDYTDVVDTDLLMFRGMKNKDGNRPDFITIKCNRPSNDYVITSNTINAIKGMCFILSSNLLNICRIQCRPLWFHKLVITARDSQ